MASLWDIKKPISFGTRQGYGSTCAKNRQQRPPYRAESSIKVQSKTVNTAASLRMLLLCRCLRAVVIVIKRLGDQFASVICCFRLDPSSRDVISSFDAVSAPSLRTVRSFVADVHIAEIIPLLSSGSSSDVRPVVSTYNSPVKTTIHSMNPMTLKKAVLRSHPRL